MSFRHLEFFIKAIVAGTFFIPLLVLPESFIFPFIVPKILVFRTLVLLLVLGYAGLLIGAWTYYRPRITPLTVAVILFLFSFAFSTFLGVDWYHSFWDNHERMLGLFTIAHYFLYYLILTAVIRERTDWMWLLRIFLWAGGIVVLLGFIQKVQPEFLLNRGASRVSATLGNPIYLSGYGLFLFFVGALLFLEEKVASWKYAALFFSMIGFLGIFLGGTRGTLLGWITGMGFVVLGYALFYKQDQRVRRACFGLVALGIVVAGTLFAFRQTTFVQNIPAVGRLLNTDISGGTANTRIMSWGIAYESWKEYPLFGWGPNNFFYAFNKHYRPEFLTRGYRETWFDNAHNIVMNTLTVQGLFGLLTYLAIFGVAIVVLFRAHQKKAISTHFFIICMAFIAAHFVHNAFVFENPTSYLYFFFFLALINARVFPVQSLSISRESNQVSWPPFIFVGCVVFFFAFVTNIQPALANQETLRALRSLYAISPDAPAKIEALLERPTPHIDDVRQDIVRTTVQALPKYIDAGHTKVTQDLFHLSYTSMQKNIELHPYDIRSHMQMATLLERGGLVMQDTKFFQEGAAVMDLALEKSPERQQLKYIMSTMLFRLGRTDEAGQLLEETIAAEPRVDEGWWRLIGLYADLGNLEKAAEVKQRADDAGVVFSAQGKNILNTVFNPPAPSIEIIQ